MAAHNTSRGSKSSSHGRTEQHRGGRASQRSAGPGQARRSPRRAGSKTSPEASTEEQRKPGQTRESALMETARQHPYASAAVGAAAGLLLAEGARRAVSSWASSQGSPGNGVNDDKDDDTRRGSQASAEDQSEDSGEEGEGDRDEGGDE